LPSMLGRVDGTDLVSPQGNPENRIREEIALRRDHRLGAP
jgi:hypothetical protein